MPFPVAEYMERLKRLRALMADRDLGMVIADEAELLHYFTGFAISENMYRAVAIPADGEPIMVVRQLDEQPFLKASWFGNRRTFHDLEDPVQVLAEVIKGSSASTGRIGLDMNSYCMPAMRFRQLFEFLPRATCVDLSDAFRPMRLIKSALEADEIRKAARIADQALPRAIDATGPGGSTRTAAAAAAAALLELGSDTGRTGPITVGRGWNFLHGGVSDDVLEAGDILHLELVPRVGGYTAKLMRPAVMGEPSAELGQAAATLIDLQDRQIAAMVPGAVAADVDAIMRRGAIDAGLRDDYVNTTGYTVGYHFEQGPRPSDFTRIFTPEADWPLEAGMTFHMYTSAKTGIAFSETVLVTDDGPERLTQLERKLFRCGESA